MKKLLFVILAAMFISPLWAQLPVTFGPQLGLNYNSLVSGGGTFSGDAKPGFVGGAFVRVKFGRFYIQPSILFSAKNSSASGSFKTIETKTTQISNGEGGFYDVIITDTVNHTYTGNVKVNYLDVPVLFGYKVVDLKVVNVRINAGPVASFNLSNSGLDSVKAYTKSGEIVKKTTWGYKVGVGADFYKFVFDIAYQGNFGQSLDFSAVSGGKPKNGLFQFTVGYKIL